MKSLSKLLSSFTLGAKVFLQTVLERMSVLMLCELFDFLIIFV